MTRKTFLGTALTIMLIIGGAGAMLAQKPVAPLVPPEPSDAEQLFLLNDGAAHLGVNLEDVTAEKAQELKLPAVAGAIVASVQKDSAAAKAGIKVDDVITEFDGEHVRSSAELRRLIRETPPGRTVAIQIMRDGKSSVLSAKLEARSNNFNMYGPEIRVPRLNVPEIHVPPMDLPDGPFAFVFRGATLGISADNLTPQLAQYFGVKQGGGVLISEVTQGGAADKAGLKAGDVIVQVDGKPVTDVEELRSSLREKFTENTRKVSLTIVRDRQEQTVNAELTRPQPLENRTSNDAGAELEQETAQLKAQLDQEVLKQKQALGDQWQRQLQEQMRALKDRLKQMQDLRLVQQQDGEI